MKHPICVFVLALLMAVFLFCPVMTQAKSWRNVGAEKDVPSDAPVIAEEPAVPSSPQKIPGNLGGKIREVLAIRQQMMRIERRIIEQDPELKALQQQFKEKLGAKLQNDREYQDLKVRLIRMREEVQKLQPGVPPERPIPDRRRVPPSNE
jgi:hypothetical protein